MIVLQLQIGASPASSVASDLGLEPGDQAVSYLGDRSREQSLMLSGQLSGQLSGFASPQIDRLLDLRREPQLGVKQVL